MKNEFDMDALNELNQTIDALNINDFKSFEIFLRDFFGLDEISRFKILEFIYKQFGYENDNDIRQMSIQEVLDLRKFINNILIKKSKEMK